MLPVAVLGVFKLARPFLPYILGGLLILGAVFWFRHQLREAEQHGYERASIEFAAQLRVAAEQGRLAVEDVRAEAAEAAAAEAADREQREQRARDLHAEALTDAQRRIDDWRTKYHRALTTDASCSRWAAETVQCPF